MDKGGKEMKKWLMPIVLLIVLTLVACSNDTEEETKNEEEEKTDREKVTFVLDWQPNTNHTGLYVAQEKGYFEEEGLEVDIQLPGEADAHQLVASGKGDFGIGAQESITEARAEGMPIVSIAAIIQHNTSGLASPVSKGIESPKDYVGKTYGGWGSPMHQAVIETMMEEDGVEQPEVEEINIGMNDFFTAVERDIDYAWIFYAWTGIEAQLRDIDLNMQYIKDYDERLDFYTPVITTNEKLIAESPETVEKFMRALSKGYEFAIDEPEEAADLLLQAVPDLDEELVKKSQAWLSPKYRDDAARWGEQKLDVWKGYAEWMKEHDLLEGEFIPEEAFTNDFLPEEASTDE